MLGNIQNNGISNFAYFQLIDWPGRLFDKKGKMGRKKSRFYKDGSGDGGDGSNKNIVPDTNKEYHIPNKISSIQPPPQLQEWMAAPSQPLPMKGKKAKQFEKYLEKKLKKDLRPEMYERLKNASIPSNVSDQHKNPLLKSTKDLNVSRKEKRAINENDGSLDDDNDNDDYLINDSIIGDNLFFVEEEESNDDDDDDDDVDEDVLDSMMNPLIDIKKEIIIRTPIALDDEEEVEAAMEETLNQRPLAKQRSEHFLIERREEIQNQRENLPIYKEEQPIMELIRRNLVVIICGETGSGKTTQVPQFLLEGAYGKEGSPNPGIIGVTQPRRVATIAMAERVQDELSSLPGIVGHQVRFDKNFSTSTTKIKFMTDGILLKEIGEDFLLTKYSIILLDEAHERNLNTDILVGLLSRTIKLRYKRFLENSEPPLRLVIMSATLDVKVFKENPNLFTPEPPLIDIKGRQHPVTVHFERQTPSDLIEAAFSKINKIHSTLPPGGILVFMTGQKEIISLIKRLDYKGSGDGVRDDYDHDDSYFFNDSDDSASDSEYNDYSKNSTTATAANNQKNVVLNNRETLLPLPLYAMLEAEEQRKIFLPTPLGQRLCVISTNIAETSITIPGIKYVIDSGLVKEKGTSTSSTKTTNVQSFRVAWTSKASALQRTGRAGRLGPGHCYRLYSSSLYEQSFPAFSKAEIERSDIASLVLMLRGMGIDEPSLFPLPTPPLKERVDRADDLLLMLGAIERKGRYLTLTVKGLEMREVPMSPRLSSILFDGMGDPLISFLVSILSVEDPFLRSGNSMGKLNFLNTPSGKKISLMKGDYTPALIAIIRYYMLNGEVERSDFCFKNNLHPKRMEEARLQSLLLLKGNVNLDDQLGRIWKVDVREQLSRHISFSYKDQIGERIIITKERREEMRRKGRKVLALPAYERLDFKNDWRVCSGGEILYLHPSSILIQNPPKFVSFSNIFIRSPNDMDTPIDETTLYKGGDGEDIVTYISNVTEIVLNWL